MVRTSVVLPLPLGPTMPMAAPASTVSCTGGSTATP